eukprot:1960878-Pyramimonas_sp.AAC.1
MEIGKQMKSRASWNDAWGPISTMRLTLARIGWSMVSCITIRGDNMYLVSRGGRLAQLFAIARTPATAMRLPG